MWRRCSFSGTAFALLSGLATPCLTVGATSDDYIFVDSFESSDCATPLSCSTPSSGKSCIAGQLFDVGTTQPLHAIFNVGLACGLGAVGGPCDLQVSAHDLVQYAGNPAASIPLASLPVVVDGCGRFRFSELTAPSTGFVAIVAADGPDSNSHTPTASPHALGPNQAIDGYEVVVATTQAVASWSLLGQADFSLGAILLTYRTAESPTAGVTAIRNGGAAGTTRYFSDADSQRLLVSAVATSTGVDGSALIANTTSGTFSGVGGETNGCHWTSAMLPLIPGVIVFNALPCIQ